MQYGLHKTPAAFQHIVNSLVYDLMNVVLYLDDIISFSEDSAQHNAHIWEILHLLSEADLFLKLEKYCFWMSEMDYLGLKISLEHIGMNPVKVSRVTDWPTFWNLQLVSGLLQLLPPFCCGLCRNYMLLKVVEEKGYVVEMRREAADGI